MLKESKHRIQKLAVLCAAFLFFGFSDGDKISPRLQQKLNAAVQTTFELETFELVPISVSTTLNQQTAVELGNENLFRILNGDTLVGYVYLGQAPSMKDIFDYVVLFTPDMAVKKSKVLIYRENYGRQIGSQRWLKQFIGKQPGDALAYGEDVDAISGATISAKSMTKAINEVLESMALLTQEGVVQ